MTREEAIAYWKQRSEHIHKWLEENEDVDFIGEYVEAIDMAIEALQTEVVRCKDCKWAEKAILDEYCVECTMYHTSCAKHGYCHHGERRKPEE